jgi:8-hydroxy-5-deazaflavin:NADPH oxidoreductase
MKLGILGAGNVGGTLGEAWSRAGHDILFGVRDSSSQELTALLQRCRGKAKAGSVQEAARFAEVAVCTLPFPAAEGVLTSVDLAGKVLLDATNPLLPDLSGLSIGTTQSAGELAAQWARGARVVKIFNTVGFNIMANPRFDGQPVPLFYCGDDAEAKKVAAGLAKDVGFEPLDAGPLRIARLLEPYAMLWIWLAYQGGYGREIAFRLIKR